MRQRSWRERSVGFGFDKRSSATFAAELHALRRAAASALPWRAGCSSSSDAIARRASSAPRTSVAFVKKEKLDRVGGADQEHKFTSDGRRSWHETVAMA